MRGRTDTEDRTYAMTVLASFETMPKPKLQIRKTPQDAATFGGK
jgi:hypothetical protein